MHIEVDGMAQIYSFKQPDEQTANKYASRRNLSAIITIIFGILGFYHTAWWILAAITFIIFLVTQNFTRQLMKDAQHEIEQFYKFSSLPDDIYVFQYVPITYDRTSVSVEYIIVTPKAIFTVWDEKSEGHFEGDADSNVEV